MIYLKEKGFNNVTGFDQSNIAVEFARRRGLNEIQGSLDCDDDVDKLPKDNDIVIMGDTLEHIFAPKRTILKIRRLLKTDGLFIVSVPNAGWFMNGILLSIFPAYYKFSNAFGSWTHLNQYTFWLLTKQLEVCGFRVERSSGITDSRFETRSKKLHLNGLCIAIDLLFSISGLLAKIKPSIFSSNIIIAAIKDQTMSVEEDYFVKD